MRKKNNNKMLLFLFFFVLCFNLSFAATVVLKSGEIIDGKIIEKTDQYIKINYDNSDLIYFLRDIEKIDESDNNLQSIADRKEVSSVGSPNSFSSYYKKGNALRKNGQINEAIVQYNKALELNIDNKSLIHLSLGQAHMWGKNYDQAIIELNESVKLEAQNAFAYSLRGYLYMVKGAFQEAISDLNKGIDILKNPPENKDFLFGDKKNLMVRLSDAYVYRGECLFMMDKPAEALNDFNEAIVVNPNNPSAYLARHQIYKKNGLSDKADLDMQEYSTIHSQSESKLLLERLIK